MHPGHECPNTTGMVNSCCVLYSLLVFGYVNRVRARLKSDFMVDINHIISCLGRDVLFNITVKPNCIYVKC